MKRTTDSMKNHLAHKIWLRFNDEYDGDMPERACLYWSDITVKVLGQHGIRALHPGRDVQLAARVARTG